MPDQDFPESAYLLAKSVTVKRGKTSVLDNVDLCVNKQSFITIIGPNGAGKTTLLKCLLGFVAPDSGTVKRMRGLKVGYVPQRFAPDLSLPITVKRFLTLRRDKRSAEPLKAAEETGADRYLDARLTELSGGEIQRVLLARALGDNPHMLILDEPAQNLDLSGQIAFYKLLEHIYANRAIAVLMVSHDLHLVMACTKQVVCLYKHVCCSGEPAAVAAAPAFRNLFGDDMAALTALYRHGGGGAHADHGHPHDAGAKR